MVISHKHKYLFVEFPHTASTAIHRELCENYAGEPILRKHAYYHSFLKSASAVEKQYFVFSGIRNPMDVLVSFYQKLKTNHKNRYTDPNRLRKNGGSVTERMLRQYRFVNEEGATFQEYFKKFHKHPYTDWSLLAHKNFDYIYRFENLQAGFAKTLKRLEIQQTRPLPLINPTKNKLKDFWDYYTPDIQDQAIRVFGPYMQQWQYSFPEDWGNNTIPWYTQLEFKLYGLARRFYSQHLTVNPIYVSLRGWPSKYKY